MGVSNSMPDAKASVLFDHEQALTDLIL